MGEFAFAIKNRGRQEWKITNIKFRFKVQVQSRYKFKSYLLSKADPLFVSETNNIITYRCIKCVFVIFTSGHVNVCGISLLEDIKGCVKLFKRHFPKYSEGMSTPIIDNISLSGRLSFSLFTSYPEIITTLSLLCDGVPSCDPFKFPATNIRTQKGTIVVFQSGVINIMGARRKGDFKFFKRVLQRLVRYVEQNQLY